jgi:hypothetical protein
MYYVGTEWFGKWPISINFDHIKQLPLYCKLHFRFILSLIGDNTMMNFSTQFETYPGLFLFFFMITYYIRTRPFFVFIRFRIISFYFFLRMKKTLDVILGHAIKCLTLRALIRNEFFLFQIFFCFKFLILKVSDLSLRVLSNFLNCVLLFVYFHLFLFL